MPADPPPKERPTFHARVMAIPPVKRRLLGLGGLLLGLLIVALGLGSIDSQNDGYVPVGTAVLDPAPPTSR